MPEKEPEREPTLEELLAQPTPVGPYVNSISESVREAFPEEPVSAPPAEDFSEEEEEYEEESPFFAFFSRNRKVLLICICSVVLVALLGIITGICYVNLSDPYDNLILNNVSVADLNLGGMTKEEATAAVEREYGRIYSTTDLVVTLSETVLTFSPEDTGAELDVKALIDDAYSYGRTGTKAEKEAAYQNSLTGVHTIGLLPYLNLKEDYIRGVLEDYASGFESIFTEASYTLEGDMPVLDTDKFDKNAHCQILLITMGTPGMGADIESLYDEILDAYSLCIFSIEKEEAAPDQLPEPPDLQAIYDELYIEPVDATVDMKTFKPIPGSYGYDFDLEEAQHLISQADFGEIVQIPMRYVEPAILDSNVLFRDVLGSCETKHTQDENRNTNLKLACQAIHDTVLMPGETFSFNDCLGQRTAEKGYKPAGTYSGTEVVDSIGGGICQISSTLYYSTLVADLEIVDRINHGLPVSYLPHGLDATVSWGYPDFKFRNNTNFPIKLQAEVSDGYVRMKILGTDEKDYYIKLESEITGYDRYETVYEEQEPGGKYKDGHVLKKGSDGIYARSYKCKYDKETHELISRDFEARSYYKRVDKVVVKIVEPEPETKPEETKPTETRPTEPTPTETTPADTTPPSESTAPPETTKPAETTPPAQTEPTSAPPPEENSDEET